MIIKVCNRITFYLCDDSTLFKRLISIYTFFIKCLETGIVVSNLLNVLLFIHLLNQVVVHIDYILMSVWVVVALIVTWNVFFVSAHLYI